MAKDARRREMILHELQTSRLEALASFSSTEVLLLTSYWPVMGTSLAVCTREGGVCAIVPEDELELAKTTSDAEFFTYEPANLQRLEPLTEALVDPVKKLASRLELKSGEVGIAHSSAAQGSTYPSTNHFRLSILPLLCKSAPELTPVPSDSIFERLKAFKTGGEVEIMRRVCQRAAVGFCEAKRAIVAGRREDEVTADIERAFARDANDEFERSRAISIACPAPTLTRLPAPTLARDHASSAG